MKIEIEKTHNDETGSSEYHISNTSSEALTVLMFALIGEARQRTDFEQFLKTITMIWGFIDEDN